MIHAMIRALISWPLAAWNAYARNRGKRDALTADAAAVVRKRAGQHAADAETFTRIMNRTLRAADAWDFGTPMRNSLQLSAAQAGEMALYHHHMAGGDTVTAAEHRRAAYEIGAMLARVPVREAAHA